MPKDVKPLRIDGGRAASDPGIRTIWSGEENAGPLRVNNPGRSECHPQGFPNNLVVDIGTPMEFPAPVDVPTAPPEVINARKGQK